MGGVEYQVTKVDPTDPETKGMVYQVHKVSEEVAATLGGKVYRARIIKDPTDPTVAGKVYQIVLIGDPEDPAVKGKVYNAILTGGSEAVIVGPAVSPLALPDAIAGELTYVKAFGGTEQNGTPTPDAPVDIVSNNGVLKASPNLFAPPVAYKGYGSNGARIENNDNYVGNWEKIVVTPGETYTVSWENIPETVGSVLAAKWDNNGDFISRNGVQKNSDGYSATYTIPEGVKQINFTLYRSGGLTISDDTHIQIEKGSTATPYVPYGQIYTDGAVETINVHGKNLFNKASIELNKIINASTGVATSNSGKYSSDYIIVKPNTTYSCNGFDDTSGINGVAFYDSNKDFVSGISYSSTVVNNKRITVPNNSSIKYMRFGSYNRTSPDDCMLVEGPTLPTTYIPYYDGGTATAEMLLKVGDYQDEQEILSGAITRNVGVKVFNGSESFTVVNNTFRYVLDNFPANTKLMSNYFNGDVDPNIGVANMPDLSIKGHGSNPRTIYFKYTEKGTVEAFQQWLADQYTAGTPVIAVYPLATPTTESVAGQTLQVTDGDNALEITQASLTGLELEAEYEKEAE